MTNIILTPIRASETQNLSVISPNTQTLFAPKATLEQPDDYGVVSYNDIDGFVKNYSYSKEEIDIKDNEVLRGSKEYTREYTYTKQEIDDKDAEVLSEANSYSDEKDSDLVNRIEAVDRDLITLTQETKDRFASVDNTKGTKIVASVDNQTYVLNFELQNSKNETISTSQIDLPLESVVVNGTYADGILTLMLKNGNSVDINIEDIISGLASEEYVNSEINSRVKVYSSGTGGTSNISNDNGIVKIENEMAFITDKIINDFVVEPDGIHVRSGTQSQFTEIFNGTVVDISYSGLYINDKEVAAVDYVNDQDFDFIGRQNIIDFDAVLEDDTIIGTLHETISDFELTNNTAYQFHIYLPLVTLTGDLNDTYKIVLRDKDGNNINLNCITQKDFTATATVSDMCQIQDYDIGIGYSWEFNGYYREITDSGVKYRVVYIDTIVRETNPSMSGEQIVRAISDNKLKGGTTVLSTSDYINNGYEYKSGHSYLVNSEYVGGEIMLSTTDITPSAENKLENVRIGLTIQSEAWIENGSISPYKYRAEVVLSGMTIDASMDAIFELINNDPIDFATYGYALASITFGGGLDVYPGGKYVFYAMEKPEDSVAFNILITAPEISVVVDA